MKFKCKLLLSSVFAFLIIFSGADVQAQHNHKHPHKHPHAKKKVVKHKKHNKIKAVQHVAVRKNNVAPAIKVLKRTNHVIVNAHKAVQQNKMYSGNLSKAISHQQYAKRLLKNNKKNRAMQHSILARKHAFVAIRYNKGVLNSEYELNSEEKRLIGKTIADEELEKELKANSPKIKFDDAVVTEEEMTDLQVLDVDPSDYKNE